MWPLHNAMEERIGVWPRAALVVLAHPVLYPRVLGPSRLTHPLVGTRAAAHRLLQAALGRSLHLCLVISVQGLWSMFCPSLLAQTGGDLI